MFNARNTFLPLGLMITLIILPGIPAQAEPETETKAKPVTRVMLSGDQHLWLMRVEGDDRYDLYHRQPQDLEASVFRVLSSVGQPHRIAASEDQLWILYKDRSVQSVRYQPAVPPEPASFPVRQHPPVPDLSAIRGWAALPGGPVVAMGDEATFWTLRFGRWRRITAPAQDRSTAEKSEQLLGLGTDRFVWLHPSPQSDGLRIDEARLPDITPETQNIEATWITHDLPQTKGQVSAFVGIRENMVRISAAPSEAPQFDLVRGGEATALGKGQTLKPKEDWLAASFNGQITLLAIDDAGTMRWWRRAIETAPEVETPAEPLQALAHPPVLMQPATLVLVGAVMASMLVVLLTSRLEPKQTLVNLPDKKRVATSRRLIAGVIDLLPGLLFSAWLFDVESLRLDQTADWSELMAVLTMIAIHVTHTTISELWMDTTIGKRLAGCRVVTISGGRPRRWQILVRNYFKIVELLLPLLLILMPLFSAHYQRLGDFIARTLVVDDTPEEPGQHLDEEA